MRFVNFIFSLTFILIFISPNISLAQNVELIGAYDNWSAYSFVEKSGKVCYVAGMPQKDEGEYSKRDDIFTIVTHRPEEKSFNVVSIVAGYTYKTGSQAEIKIGSDSFSLFTHEGTAWAKNTATDKQIVDSMIKGSRMVIKGFSSRGTATTDTYSLVGFTDALNAINKACKH